MGTALRKLVAVHKGTDESISGKGKLTDVRIKELTNYYGKAIKSHAGNLQEMEVAVWATFFSFFLFFFIPSAPMTTHNMTCVQKAVSPGVFTSGPLLRTGNPVTTGAPCRRLLSEPWSQCIRGLGTLNSSSGALMAKHLTATRASIRSFGVSVPRRGEAVCAL